MEPFRTVKEILERKKIPIKRNTLYKVVRLKKVRSYRVGKNILLLESELYEDFKNNFKTHEEIKKPHLRNVSHGFLRLPQKKKTMVR